MADNDNKQNEPVDKRLLSLRWMLRPCETYREEYSDCTSIKARFHQYFIHGETIDCKQWKVDHDNCIRWNDDGNVKALSELIASEEDRREERLRPHYLNDVWKKREEPPSDWNKPLPDWLEEENKVTYLAIKAEELRNKGSEAQPSERTLCVIM